MSRTEGGSRTGELKPNDLGSRSTTLSASGTSEDQVPGEKITNLTPDAFGQFILILLAWPTPPPPPCMWPPPLLPLFARPPTNLSTFPRVAGSTIQFVCRAGRFHCLSVQCILSLMIRAYPLPKPQKFWDHLSQVSGSPADPENMILPPDNVTWTPQFYYHFPSAVRLSAWI